MKKLFYLTISIALLLGVTGCSKDPVNNSNSTRLVQVRSAMKDSVGNECSSCFSYQLFSYDASGRLISVRDSMAPIHSNRYVYINGPNAYNTIGTYGYYKKIEFTTQGYPSKATRDSFVYNSRNLLVQRYRRVQCPECQSYLIDNYTYDNKDRLIADTSYTGQTFLVPVIVINDYKTFTYDINDNVIQYDLYQVWGTPTHYTTLANYDNKVSPYKSNRILLYMAYGNPLLLSSNNPVYLNDQFTYNANGLPVSYIYQKLKQDFFYE